MRTWKNNFSDYTVEDFLLDDSYISWVINGKDTQNKWSDRLLIHQDLATKSKIAEEMIRKLGPDPAKEVTDRHRIEKLKRKIDARIDAIGIKERFGSYQPDPGSGRKRKNMVRYASIAALIFIVLAAYVMIGRRDHQDIEPQQASNRELKSTRAGQKLTVYLNDGSKVKLNSGSQIKYAKYFSDTSRIITLSGEAFFEVAKDSLRPFIVYTKNAVTKALGTSFNINARSGSPVYISLVTGKVAIENADDHSKVILAPGEQATVNNSRGLNVIPFEYKDIAWKDDIIVFKAASRTEVFNTLKLWYGVDFEFENAGNEPWDYSATFENKSLREVLLNLSYAENFSFTIQNKKVVINLRGSH